MKKFIRDTLMEYDKFHREYSFSMRRIIIAICFPYALSIGCHVVYGDQTNSTFAVDIFKTVFLFVAVGLGINLMSYIKNEKPKDDNNEQIK